MLAHRISLVDVPKSFEPSTAAPPAVGGEAALSTVRIAVYSVLSSFSVLVVGLVLQWIVYHDWMHRSGPVRIVGSTIAAVVTFLFVLHWQAGIRERQLEALRRFQVIAEMNDRIRNALQKIECLSFASDRHATEGIRQAVEAIDAALEGVVAESKPPRVAVSAIKRSARSA